MKWITTFLTLWLCACATPPLPVMSQLPSFQLTAQTGQPFDSKSLEGRIWVADFVYTTCPGPCPMMSKQMGEVQRQTAAMPDVKLVSFTVDPAHDTPPVLTAYGKHFQANPNRWSFLTGDANRLNELGRDGFKLNSVDGTLTHSTRFVLVDRKMRIRGYYSSDEDGIVTRLVSDVRALF